MKRDIILKIALLVSIIFVLLEHNFCYGGQSVLKGGCAKVNITPPVGIWLTGYGSRDKPSDDIVDELYTKALVLDDGENTIAIVCNDLLWIPLEITTEIREIVKEKTGIPEENVLISGTHTHFGPKIFTKTNIGPKVPASEIDKSYVQTLVKKIAGSVFIAYKNMKEVKVGAVKGEIPEIVYNRRTKRIDGSLVMTYTIPSEKGELIFGPIDPEVCILRVEDISGEIFGSIVNFACHPVSGSTYNDWFYSISADFPAYTMRVVEQMEGGICLFALGTAGDIVPIKRGRKPRLQVGKALGGEVLRRLQFVTTSGDVTLKALKKSINIPIKKTLSPDRIIDVDKSANYLTTEIQVIRIGDIYILGLPGEILVEIGLEIKKRADLENLFVISLSNDAIGYVCHSEAYDEGGYEPTSGTNLAKGAGEIIIEEALNIINRIR